MQPSNREIMSLIRGIHVCRPFLEGLGEISSSILPLHHADSSIRESISLIHGQAAADHIVPCTLPKPNPKSKAGTAREKKRPLRMQRNPIAASVANERSRLALNRNRICHPKRLLKYSGRRELRWQQQRPCQHYMCLIISSANAEHFTSVAPSMRRAKS